MVLVVEPVLASLRQGTALEGPRALPFALERLAVVEAFQGRCPLDLACTQPVLLAAEWLANHHQRPSAALACQPRTPVALASTVARSSASLPVRRLLDLPYMPKHCAVAQVQLLVETLLIVATEPAVRLLLTLVSPPTEAPVMSQVVPDPVHPVAAVSASTAATAAAAAAAEPVLDQVTSLWATAVASADQQVALVVWLLYLEIERVVFAPNHLVQRFLSLL